MFSLFKKKDQAPTEKKNLPNGIAPLSMNLTPKWSEDFGELSAITEGYKGSTWVYACVKLKANSLASVPIILEKRVSGGWEKVDNHPVLDLIESPSPDFNRSELMKMLVTHLELLGNACIYKNRAGASNRIIELFPLLPQYIEPVAGIVRLIDIYRYKQPHSKQVEYDQADVMHVSHTNPDSLYWGQSPLQAAGKAVDIDNEAKDYQKNSFENRGIAGGMFSLKGDTDQDEVDNIRGILKTFFTGKKNSRAPLVMSDATYHNMGMTPAEMDFMLTRGFTLKEIAAAYGVPIEMISGMGDANRASSETVRKTFWIDSMIPLLVEVATALNLQLLKEFDKTGNLRLRFDTSKVPALQESLIEKLAVGEKLYAMGVPFNVINKELELGFDEIDGGDVGYIRSGLIPSSFDFDDSPSESLEEEAKSAYGAK
tara:strand:- start:110 stop:1390 length:1281 start_codon:yes stop_codon:yes gene_type:complete